MSKIREPVSCLSHLFAGLFFLPFCIFIIVEAIWKGNWVHVFSVIFFTVSLVLLYGASTIYHLCCVRGRALQVLKKIDHVMIFILIIGSYVPVCLIPLKGPVGYYLLSAVVILSCFGIALKVVKINVSRWISSVIYLSLGWLILLAFYPLLQTVRPKDLQFLVYSGLFYTIGAFIYPSKKLQIRPGFGVHEIFHFFVIAGTAMQIIFTYTLLKY